MADISQIMIDGSDPYNIKDVVARQKLNTINNISLINHIQDDSALGTKVNDLIDTINSIITGLKLVPTNDSPIEEPVTEPSDPPTQDPGTPPIDTPTEEE